MTTPNTTPLKPAIGSKLQNNPFLAKDQGMPSTTSNSKKTVPTKKTTEPAWLQKPTYTPSKRASLLKMSKKVASNPWKAATPDSSPLARNNPIHTKSTSSTTSTRSSTTTSPITSPCPSPSASASLLYSKPKIQVPNNDSLQKPTPASSPPAKPDPSSSTPTIPSPTASAEPPSEIPSDDLQSSNDASLPPTDQTDPESSTEPPSPVIENQPGHDLTPTLPATDDASAAEPLPTPSTPTATITKNSPVEPVQQLPQNTRPVSMLSDALDPLRVSTATALLATASADRRDSLLDLILPWQEHVAVDPPMATSPMDYDVIVHQLVVSHAVASSRQFTTFSFDDALQLQSKYQTANDDIDAIGSRLATEIKAQRMLLSMYQLSDQSGIASDDRLDQLDRLVQDLMEGIRHDHARREQFLKHLAGTLAKQCTHLENQLANGSMSVFDLVPGAALGGEHLLKERQWLTRLKQELLLLIQDHFPDSIDHLHVSSPALPSDALSSALAIAPSSSSSSSTYSRASSDDGSGFSSSDAGTSMTSLDQQDMLDSLLLELHHYIDHIYRQLGSRRPVSVSPARLLQIQELEASLAQKTSMADSLAHDKKKLQMQLDLERENTSQQRTAYVDLQRQHRLLKQAQQDQERLLGTDSLKTVMHQRSADQQTIADLYQQLSDMEASHKATMHELRSTNTTLADRLFDSERELRELKRSKDDAVAALEQSLRDTTQRVTDQQAHDWQAKLDEADSAWQTRHAAALEAAKLDWQNTHSAAQDDWQQSHASAKSEWELALAATKAEWEQTHAAAKAEWDQTHAAAKSEWEQTHAAAKSEWEQTHAAAQAEWQQAQAATDAQWQDKHSTAQAEWEANHAAALAELNTTHAAALAACLATHAATVAEWQEKQVAAEAEWHEKHKAVETEWQDKHAAAQAEWQQTHTALEQARTDDRQQWEAQAQAQDQTQWKAKYDDLHSRMETCDDRFKKREDGYLTQTANLEGERDQLLREYERITRNIADFASERKKYEQQIADMQRHGQQLETQVADLKVQQMAVAEGQQGSTTMALRKEFRQLMAQTKAQHQQQLEAEITARHTMEQERRNEQQESERLLWDRVNAGVQTSFTI
ncbi:hypothetical protein DM01DRAFT_1055412 [Hesseltinella vesiculosa]|uniref:Up-regulated during septation protein 1 domain-containing protein n=1 Tax=Hesseltinella vesiculosa TaxID=101127 RepID=A0A1X2GFQ2_9FUNG|nr:hypothetical protein DM01DRAFT_1055412 [Hesseltinella vesiculosa]